MPPKPVAGENHTPDGQGPRETVEELEARATREREEAARRITAANERREEARRRAEAERTIADAREQAVAAEQIAAEAEREAAGAATNARRAGRPVRVNIPRPPLSREPTASGIASAAAQPQLGVRYFKLRDDIDIVEPGFRENLAYHSKRRTMAKEGAYYTPHTSAFIIAVLAAIATALTSSSADGNKNAVIALTATSGVIAVISSFIVFVFKGIAATAKEDLGRLAAYGAPEGYFLRIRAALGPEDDEVEREVEVIRQDLCGNDPE